MVEQGKSKENWWHTFQKASYPAYVTLVDPPSLEGLDTDAAQIRVKALHMDDVLDPAGYRRSSAPHQFEVAEGSYVLVLPSDASSATAQFVSPPWLCRVNRMWFLPGGEQGGAGGGSSYLEVKSTRPEVQAWEQQQIQQGRVAAQNFQLQVTYFYRWPDLADAVEGSSSNMRRLAHSLKSLGIIQNEKEVEGLLKKRGCGRTPPNHFGMRYVVFSNHETKDPRPAADSKDEDEDESDEEEAEDCPVPMESVMGTAQVLFLPSDSKLPYQQAQPPAAALAAAGDSAKVRQLPLALQTRLAGNRRELVPGFMCNMFLVKAEGPEQQPKLFGLSEWAEGIACRHLQDRPWVATSRQQVQQLLAETQRKLQAAGPAAGGQQRLGGTSDAVATAAAAGDAEDDDHFVDARSRSQHEEAEHKGQSGEEDAAGAGGIRKQQQPRLSARGAAAGGGRTARAGEGAAAGAGRGSMQQQQQQHHPRRRVLGLESEEEEEHQQQHRQQEEDQQDLQLEAEAEQQQQQQGQEYEDEEEEEGEEEEKFEEGELLSSGEDEGELAAQEECEAATTAAPPPAAKCRSRKPKSKGGRQQQQEDVALSAPAALEEDDSGSRQHRAMSKLVGVLQHHQHHSKQLRIAAAAAAGEERVRRSSGSGSNRRNRGSTHQAAGAAAGLPHKRHKR